MSSYIDELDPRGAVISALELIPEDCTLRYIEVWGDDSDSIVVLRKDKEVIIITEFDSLYQDYIKEGFTVIKDD